MRLNKRFYVITISTMVLAAGVAALHVDNVCRSEERELLHIEEAQAMTIERPVTEVSFNEVEAEPQLISLGDFVITHYCTENYPHICNDGDATRTATGTRPAPGRTIAVDPDVIPYGSEVVINGHTFVAEDTGGAINQNRIDIVVDTHEEALQKGKFTAEVFLVR